MFEYAIMNAMLVGNIEVTSVLRSVMIATIKVGYILFYFITQIKLKLKFMWFISIILMQQILK